MLSGVVCRSVRGKTLRLSPSTSAVAWRAPSLHVVMRGRWGRWYSSTAQVSGDVEFKYDLNNRPNEFLSLQPEEIAKELDKYIVGQADAKRAVAVAMRNRWRRNKVPEKLRKEIMPKNILMIGPTGCGKTEVARRMAKLAEAPFIKVEATKYTEVGFKGADVDQIIKDLLEIAIRLVKERETQKLKQLVKDKVDETLLDLLVGKTDQDDPQQTFTRSEVKQSLLKGLVENVEVNYEPRVNSNKVPNNQQNVKFPAAVVQLQSIFSAFIQPKPKKTKYFIKEIRPLEEEAQIQNFLPEEAIVKRAIFETEEYGIVFIDELDKIIPTSGRFHADASDEGVQRDLLPLIEGTKITTDHGEVDTSNILFITAGAFHHSKPSDLLAELQGRLPIRVQLHDLNEEELYRILTEPEAHAIKQYRALLKTEGVDLRFTDEALREIAKITSEVNQTVENIGARRLSTVLERILEDISFNASNYKAQTVIIDKEDVDAHMVEFKKKADLKQYIL
uniref:AAA+ ATPase domain-containing protein n=1 Tax=Arcella intermedia TaxID=1963864 RepID=A0A6B2L2D5_9EUKA